MAVNKRGPWRDESALVFRNHGWAYGVIVWRAGSYEWWACNGWNSAEAISRVAQSLEQAKREIRRYRKDSATKRGAA